MTEHEEREKMTQEILSLGFTFNPSTNDFTIKKGSLFFRMHLNRGITGHVIVSALIREYESDVYLANDMFSDPIEAYKRTLMNASKRVDDIYKLKTIISDLLNTI